VDGQPVHPLRGAGVVHPLEIDQVVHSPLAPRRSQGGGQAGGQHLHVGVGGLCCRVRRLEERGVGGGVGRPVAPLKGQVRLIPDDDMVDEAVIAAHERRHERGIVRIVVAVDVAEGRIGRPRPGGHIVDAGDQAHALVGGVPDDHVGMGPVIAPPGRLVVGPRKVLDRPRAPHLAHQLEGALHLPLLDLVRQAGVHADQGVRRNDRLRRIQRDQALGWCAEQVDEVEECEGAQRGVHGARRAGSSGSGRGHGVWWASADMIYSAR